MKNTAYFFIVAIAVVVVLIFGKSLLIPFVFALLLWFMVREIKTQMNKVAILKKHIPNWGKTFISSMLLIAVLAVVSSLISSNIRTLAKSYPVYESNVDGLIQKVNMFFNIDLITIAKGKAGEFDFGKILSAIFNSITDILSSAFMILIYAIFIFLEEAYFQAKLKNVFKDNEQYGKASEILGKIEISISKYISLKTLVSLITGIASYIALLFIGIDSPFFWAFLIFLLNYIPTIGSLIATIFPSLFCLLQFGEFTPALLVLIFVGAIQVIVGNFLEPKLLGNSMNLSPLITIIALTFWGAIWGITGMILSIPITVIMVIIFAQIPSMKSVAVMLSQKGTV